MLSIPYHLSTFFKATSTDGISFLTKHPDTYKCDIHQNIAQNLANKNVLPLYVLCVKKVSKF